MSRTPSTELTPVQKKVLRICEKLQDDMDRFPSIRQIVEALGLQSTNSVRPVMHALERKGFLRRDESDQRRGWKLPPKPANARTEALERVARAAREIPREDQTLELYLALKQLDSTK